MIAYMHACRLYLLLVVWRKCLSSNEELFFVLQGSSAEKEREREGGRLREKDRWRMYTHTRSHTTHLHHLECPLVDSSDLRVHCVPPTLKPSHNVLRIVVHH